MHWRIENGLTEIAHKWRPPLALIVTGVCASLLALPLVAIIALQIGTNWFVQETESSLIKQAAIYASAYSLAFESEAKHTPVSGYYLPPDKRVFWNARVRTFRSILDLRSSQVEPALPDPLQSDESLDAKYKNIARTLGPLEDTASRVTLSKAIFLDFQGLNVLSETPTSYANVPEVQKALRGEVGAALHWRSRAEMQAPFLSFVRGAGFRVVVGYPVISYNRVVGAIFITRTPMQLDSYLSRESLSFLILILVTLLGALIVAGLLVRIVLKPIRALRDQSRHVAEGAHDDLAALNHYGIREVAELGNAVMKMADSLSQRTREIQIYTDHVTHELKSPVTAIVGAVELLEDGNLPQPATQELLVTIRSQSIRMSRLLSHLREVNRRRRNMPGEPGSLRSMLPDIPGLTIKSADGDAELPLSSEHGKVILEHMAQNAVNHGADLLELEWGGRVLRISDNGQGFETVNLDRLGEPFFTTRRSEGGTGLGLAIVIAILDLYNAKLTPIRGATGAVFDISFR
ncbi:signal transduction histidine kinase [Agrobacterium larrymoorei]|uniref:Signal transduction histidine-protein kinase/phosphatase MprB n=1 Tax=Agrobacterium larrymoorei TaxID=160699 RepID=A0AAJ2B861_9HYPH|nr:signal transduction histidine kinase [Agrobacterium larrymoorei]